MVDTPLGGEFIEASSGFCMAGLSPTKALPAPNAEVDVERIDFQAAATPPNLFGGDQRAPAAEEAVEHEVPACRTVHDRVGKHCDWLDGRVPLQELAVFAIVAPEIVG